MTDNTFQYAYAPQFGNTTDNQQDLDKHVLKALSQNHKESTLSFPQLIKKIKAETQHRVTKELALKKQSLSTDLAKLGPSIFLYPTQEGFDGTKGEGSVSAKLQLIPYSTLSTKRESTFMNLTLTSTIYREDCTSLPPCKDCTANGPYSACHTRRPVKHDACRTIPLAHYWQYALYGKALPGSTVTGS